VFSHPVWDPDASEETVETLASLRERREVRIRVWSGDGCGDCRALLPEFGAAVRATGLDDALVGYTPGRAPFAQFDGTKASRTVYIGSRV
jgi:hypothetical protein